PGQGAQRARMGAQLYERIAAFREEIDRCAEHVRVARGRDLRDVLFGGEDLAQTEWTQPALFAVEYALARTLIACGVQPAVMLGHSLGEYVAACLASVVDLRSA